jgi:transcriptional regulator with XRE-family HTH domain
VAVTGRRSLLAVLQRTSAREVAARCGVVPSCVSSWVNGTRRPCERARAVLASVYGISVGSWVATRPAIRRYADRLRR